MLLADGAFGVVLTLVWIFCIIDAITTPEPAVRNLPKLLWVLIVVLLLDVGSIAWLVAGRPRKAPLSLPPTGRTDIPPEYDRPGRAAASNPDDDAAFLEQLRRRAEEQRRKAQDDEAP